MGGSGGPVSIPVKSLSVLWCTCSEKREMNRDSIIMIFCLWEEHSMTMRKSCLKYTSKACNDKAFKLKAAFSEKALKASGPPSCSAISKPSLTATMDSIQSSLTHG